MANSSIPSFLQLLWDTTLADSGLMLILCGSSMGYIENSILGYNCPLYGRADGIYKMQEMDFYDSCRFFPQWDAESKVLAYATLGGTPYILEKFDSKKSFRQNVLENVLFKGCALYSETEFLLRQELKEPMIYNAVIEAIATGSTRLNEINQRSYGESVSKTSMRLKALQELGFVYKEYSVDAGNKDRISDSRGLYELSDNFFRFWYTFGQPYISMLEDGSAEQLYDGTIKPAMNHFAARTFEGICTQFVKRMAAKGTLPIEYNRIGRWYGKTKVRTAGASGGYETLSTEIDILAYNEASKEFIAGECKFKDSPFTFADYLTLAAKLGPEPDDGEAFVMLFSKSGFDEKLTAMSALSGSRVRLYTLEDVVDCSACESFCTH